MRVWYWNSQLKILIYLLKKTTVIYSGTIYNLFCIFQVSSVFSYFHNFKNKKETEKKIKHRERLSECLIMEGEAKYPQTQRSHFWVHSTGNSSKEESKRRCRFKDSDGFTVWSSKGLETTKLSSYSRGMISKMWYMHMTDCSATKRNN